MAAYLDLIPTWILSFPAADKVFHFLLFGGLAFWLHLALHAAPVRFLDLHWPRALVILFPIVAAEELSQSLSSVRGVDPGDLISNWLGLLMFWLLSVYVLRAQQRRCQQGLLQVTP
jgi:hypothetical protein